MKKLITKKLKNIEFEYNEDDTGLALRVTAYNGRSYYLHKKEAKALGKFINKEIK